MPKIKSGSIKQLYLPDGHWGWDKSHALKIYTENSSYIKLLIIAFFGFDSRHTISKNESAKSSFLIFPYLTPQVASDGHIVFPKPISRFLGPLYQMTPRIIAYMYCSRSKYSYWQHEERLEEWEEGPNVKYRCTKARKDFFFLLMVYCSLFWNQ